MVIKEIGDSFYYNGIKYVVGEEIIGTDQSEYEGLIGRIIEIRDGTDQETDNTGPDIYCEFDPPVSPYDINELEKRFSELYGEPKKLETIALDMVIMAPEMIISAKTLCDDAHFLTVYSIQEHWAVDNESGSSVSVYLDYHAARLAFSKMIADEMQKGSYPSWSDHDNFVCNSSKDCYEEYLDSEYESNHYSVQINVHIVPLPSLLFSSIGRQYTDCMRAEDFKDQIEGWDEVEALTDEQYQNMISDPMIPSLIKAKLEANDFYWEAYWESVSEVAHEIVRRYSAENRA